MTFDQGLEGRVGVCYWVVRSSLSLEGFRQRLNGHLSKAWQTDCWVDGKLSQLTSRSFQTQDSMKEPPEWNTVVLTYILPSINTVFPILCLMGIEESCCQPKRVYAGIKGENLSFLCPKGMYLFRHLNWMSWHGMVRWTKWENKESWGWRGKPCSSAHLAEFGGVPLAQVGSGCTEPSFAVALLALAKAATQGSLSAVQHRLCPSVKKSNGDKGEIPKEKSASRVSQPHSWVSLLENTWIVHILDSAQVNTGAVRRSHRPFSSPVGLRGPTDRWADRPAIVACIWWYIKCILRRAWGLRLLGLLSRALWGNLNV